VVISAEIFRYNILQVKFSPALFARIILEGYIHENNLLEVGRSIYIYVLYSTMCS